MKTKIGVAASIAVVIAAVCLAFRAPEHGKSEKYLYVWAGDQARKNPDFLAVVDFDETSANYGRVVRTVPLHGAGAIGNEPHHVGLSANGRILAAGGLLSVLRGQPEVFFFDVSRPSMPRLIAAADPPQSSVTDEFYALPNGGFLVTMMGGSSGHAPGRVVEFSPSGKVIAEHPRTPPDDGFNPHGISVRADLNLMVTSDFICPSSTLHSDHGENGDLTMRGSVRVWDFRKREITRTIKLAPGTGTIDFQLIPNDRAGRGYTAGMTDGKLYLINPSDGSAKPVFDFAGIARDAWPQLLRLTRDGRRMFIGLNQAGKVAMLDITSASQPRLMKVLDLGAGSGPHYLALSPDEKRLVVTDYFLNEDLLGKVHAEGDHKVHVAHVTGEDMVLDSRFRLDFNSEFPAGPARPHGVAFSR